MNTRICIGCGEPMPEKANALSGNPNLCASCFSMADGMEESDTPEFLRPEGEPPLAGDQPGETRKAA